MEMKTRVNRGIISIISYQFSKSNHPPSVLARARGAMDNASDYGSEDSRFESWRARNYLFEFNQMLLLVTRQPRLAQK